MGSQGADTSNIAHTNTASNERQDIVKTREDRDGGQAKVFGVRDQGETQALYIKENNNKREKITSFFYSS